VKINVRRSKDMLSFRLIDRMKADTDRTPRRRFGVPGSVTFLSAAPRRRFPAPGSVVLLLVVLMGCTDGDRADTAGQNGSQVVPDPAGVIRPGAEPSTEPAGPANGGQPADERETDPGAVAGAGWTAGDTRMDMGSAGAAMLRDLRIARHDGFDRIVLDFADDDVPSYRISYIDRPVRQCGSGDTVPFAGDAWLSIRVEPANAHTEEGAATVAERERAPNLPSVLELKLICDFEAIVEIVAGVSSPEQYRAFVLASPNRLVVDIRHPGTR
jgi:hypothetical protein